MLNARARRELAITAQITSEEEIQVDANCQDIVPQVVTVEVPGIQGPPGKTSRNTRRAARFEIALRQSLTTV